MIQRLLKEGLRSFISVFLWTLSQDCDDAFNGHQHRKSSKVFDICIFFICMYIYNTILCIILPLHQITKNKLCKCEGVSNAASMGGMVNLTSLAFLTAVINLSQFLFYWKSRKHYRRVFIFLFEQNGNAKNIFVVLSYSLLFMLTQLWRLPLLRNPVMWKMSIVN